MQQCATCNIYRRWDAGKERGNDDDGNMVAVAFILFCVSPCRRCSCCCACSRHVLIHPLQNDKKSCTWIQTNQCVSTKYQKV